MAAVSQMLIMASSSGKVLTFQTSAVDPVDRTIYTFTAQAIGNATADRYVIVGATGSNSPTITGVKCATVSMTSLANAASSAEGASLWILLVTSGTTADIEVTFSAGTNRCGIGVWSATGLSSATPVATGTSATTTAPTIATAAGGFAVAITHPTGASPTWAVLTSDFATDTESGVYTSGAHGATTGANITPTVTSSGASRCTMAVASF